VTGATGAERIARAFASRTGQAALMPYLMGGDPSTSASRKVGEAFAEAGADLVEVGVPFSDPLADGPVIQAAGQRALEAGATLESVVAEVAAPLSQRLPVVLMCYANPIFARGFARVAQGLGKAGVAGLIVPDLPVDEAGELREMCDAAGIALVPLVAPTTPPDRIEANAAAARGFVYVVSVTGVTGERGELSKELRAVVERVRSIATVPVAVGFGIGTPTLARAVGEIADGVIIGSRLVRAISEAESLESGLAEAARFLVEARVALSTERNTVT
jgi:tryptophan synthase alpha chain